jgi:hypothetical protein
MPVILPDPPPPNHRGGLIVKCPNCGSTETHRFNAGKKVALFGVFAAGSIGKTWECWRCSYKW